MIISTEFVQKLFMNVHRFNSTFMIYLEIVVDAHHVFAEMPRRLCHDSFIDKLIRVKIWEHAYFIHPITCYRIYMYISSVHFSLSTKVS